MSFFKTLPIEKTVSFLDLREEKEIKFSRIRVLLILTVYKWINEILKIKR